MIRRIKRLVEILRKRKLTRETPRQRGIAIIIVIVTTAVIAAAAGDFAYSAQVELEAAVNSRDQMRAEYLARSGMQIGVLLTAVQGSLGNMLQGLPPEFRDAIVVTDYAGFIAKALTGDQESREGLGGLIGIDLSSVEGMGTPAGTNLDIKISSEEGKFSINCGGGYNTKAQLQRNLYALIANLIRPQRYDRMFNIADRDGVVIMREDLPINIIDWSDVDISRFNPLGGASASEETYDRGQDRYEPHNHYFDTTDELNLVRGISEDFYSAFGEMFTVYGSDDCRVLASAVEPEEWPLIAAMIAASSSDRNAVFDPNTAIVAQQVSGLLKTGLPALKQLSSQVSIPPCKVEKSLCTPQSQLIPTQLVQPPPGAPPAGATDQTLDTLSNVICSPAISQLPALSESLSSLIGGTAPPKPTTGLRPIPMCPGMLGQYLRTGSTAKSSNPRRFYRLDATGSVQRGQTKITQVHIRGVWNAKSINSNPLCNNHPSCWKGGTWMYYRID